MAHFYGWQSSWNPFSLKKTTFLSYIIIVIAADDLAPRDIVITKYSAPIYETGEILLRIQRIGNISVLAFSLAFVIPSVYRHIPMSPIFDADLYFSRIASI